MDDFDKWFMKGIAGFFIGCFLLSLTAMYFDHSEKMAKLRCEATK